MTPGEKQAKNTHAKQTYSPIQETTGHTTAAKSARRQSNQKPGPVHFGHVQQKVKASNSVTEEMNRLRQKIVPSPYAVVDDVHRI